MTKPAHGANPRWLGFLLAALVAALVTLFGAGTASAATASAAQTRVGAHTLVAPLVVGPVGGIGAGQRLGNDLPAYDSALATGVAAETGAAAAESETGLIRLSTRESWGNPRTLEDHFVRHGGDFGATSADDYAAQASRFLQRGAAKLPTKVGSDGTIRIYDSSTNSFGSYRPDGLTKTFFKPQSANYWQTQPGVLQ
jgi:hypothetical protein